MQTIQAFLLDVEGTVAPITFVVDVLFPYARDHLVNFLTQRANDANVLASCKQILIEAGQSQNTVRLGPALASHQIDSVVYAVQALMDRDAKTTGLKQLQGMIWDVGFRSGELQSVLYDDVVPFLEACRSRGLPVRIYSSGSIQAQMLYFGHTQQGDLLSLLSGHHDTTVGPKSDPASYQRIATAFGLPSNQIMFVSDALPELEAARECGMRTTLAVRPGNSPVLIPHDHQPWPGSMLALLPPLARDNDR